MEKKTKEQLKKDRDQIISESIILGVFFIWAAVAGFILLAFLLSPHAQ